MNLSVVAASLLFSMTVLPIGSAPAQTGARWADLMSYDYTVVPNVTYSIQDSRELKADLYLRGHRSGANAVIRSGANPVILSIHGGGLVGGSKDDFIRLFAPFLELGYSIVNIDYRLAENAHAPAAIEDARCALYWIAANAGKYGFDPDKIVTMGASSGGHLALITAMLRPSDGYDDGCGSVPQTRDAAGPRVAGVISWSGVADELDSYIGPDARKWARVWIGSQPNGEQIARDASAVYRVRPGLPPILLIHGTADPIVPYTQATHLHRELDRNHDPNLLLTLQGGGHVTFSPEQWQAAWNGVRAFLKQYGLLPPAIPDSSR